MKKMILTLAIVFFAASVSAQTLQNFESSFDENFQKNLAGGEGFKGTINFTSSVDRSVPLVVEVTVDSDETSFAKGEMKGGEFDLDFDYEARDFDWKPAAWNLVERDRREIILADESVRENSSIPEAVAIRGSVNKSNVDLPEGFSWAYDRSDIENVDLTYDPETTPHHSAEESLTVYSGDKGYLPVGQGLLNHGFVLLEGDINVGEEMKDGLNASDYELDPPVISEKTSEKTVTRVDEDTLKYSFALKGISVYPESENSVFIDVRTNPLIEPDSFDFNFKVKSEVGVGGETVNKTLNASEPAKIVTPSNEASVTVNSSSEANVTVQDLDSVSTSSPENADEFVGGVSVDVSNSSGQVEASGVVTVSYDDESLDSRDMNVYFYNDTGDSNEWVNVGGTQYPGNNTVSEEVSHFSTYAAFAQQESTSDSQDDSEEFSSSAGPIPYDPQEEEQNQTQPQNGTVDEGDESDLNETTGQQENQGDQQTGEQESQEGDGNEGVDSSAPQSPTGQFVSSPSGMAALAFVMIALIAAYLQYSGRVDIRKKIPV